MEGNSKVLRFQQKRSPLEKNNARLVHILNMLKKQVRQGRVDTFGFVIVTPTGNMKWDWCSVGSKGDTIPVGDLLDAVSELEGDIRRWRRDVWARSEE